MTKSLYRRFSPQSNLRPAWYRKSLIFPLFGEAPDTISTRLAGLIACQRRPLCRSTAVFRLAVALRTALIPECVLPSDPRAGLRRHFSHPQDENVCSAERLEEVAGDVPADLSPEVRAFLVRVAEVEAD